MTTGRVVSWPSPELPGLPGFEITVPQDWTARTLPGLLAVVGPLVKSLETNGFVPTVTVTGEAVRPGSQANDILEMAVGAILRTNPGTLRSPRAEPTTLCSRKGAGVIEPESAASVRLHARNGEISTEHVSTVVVVPTAQTIWHAFSVTSAWSPSTSESDPGLALQAIHSSFQLVS